MSAVGRISWWRRIANRRAPDIVIGKPGDDYLRRWYLIQRNPLFNIYLHQFTRSDDDRALHDHPWWNVSFILEGGYIEHTIKAGGINHRVQRNAGDFKFRLASSAHRVELINGQAAWTLFLTGPRIRDWGFHCPAGWRHWRDFTSGERGEQIGRGCEGLDSAPGELPWDAHNKSHSEHSGSSA
jgi:hypothetical protein